MNKLVVNLGLGAGLIFATVPFASAVPQIRLIAGASTRTITDNGPGDFDPTPGIIVFSGGVGTRWASTVEVGRSKPDIGSAAMPSMDLSVNARSKPNHTAPPTLKILFSDTGFVGMFPGGAQLDTAIGGTSDGSVTFKTWIDYGNTPFGGYLLNSQVFNPAGGSFSADGTEKINGTIPYSLTIEWDITHPNGNKLTTGDSSLRFHAPDGGMTLALLGSSLVGLAALRRKF